MRTWLPTLLLLLAAACDDDVAPDETDSGTDTDVDTDTGTTPELGLTVDALERTVLAPGESVTVDIRLENAPPDVSVEATPTVEGCVTTEVTGLDGDAPQLTLTGGTAYLGDCNVTVEASGPGGASASVDVAVRVDVSWEGEVIQWGDGGVSRLGTLFSHEGRLLTVCSVERVDTPALSLERRDAWGELLDVAAVEGPAWEGGAFAGTAQGDQAWFGVTDVTGQAFVIPVDGGTVGPQWAIEVEEGASLIPDRMGVIDDTVWLVGLYTDAERRRGVAFATWSTDGTNPTWSTYFAPDGNLLASAVARTESGWRVGGLAYGTPFPEVEDDIEWGSWIGDFDESGSLTGVQRLGIANTQLRHLEVLGDGRTVLGGFVRNVDLDGNTTTTGYDAFLRLVEADGTVAWTRYVATDGDERIYTFRVLEGTIVAGGTQEDAGWALGVDLASGEVQWEKSWGSDGTDISTSSIHGHGVVLGGFTTEALSGELTGIADRWMVRLGPDGSAR